uniref:Abhydrolase domain containing 17A, depalmitoylase n=1 Tax=Pan troglodytes TaxID=9598 RepID=H2R6I8_PANTR
MNGLSLSELCCLFCCPPCPGRIAAKLAFLPPEATYSLVPEPEPGPGGAGAAPLGTLRASSGAPGRWKLHLTERADFQYSQRELDTIEVFPTKSARGNRVSCMYVRCVPGPAVKGHPAQGGHPQLAWVGRLGDSNNPAWGTGATLACGYIHLLARYTVLFSHGNAVDLGQMSSFYIGLGSRLHCNIFSYDYSGYGASSGRPSERNLYADIDAAWQALRRPWGQGSSLYCQGVLNSCAQAVLHSSGMRVAFPDTKKTYCFDAFPNIEKVSKITSPVLIIHGTEDEVIDFSHGLALYERCPKAVEPLWVEGAGHNDIELYSQYLERLRRFISQELPSQRA